MQASRKMANNAFAKKTIPKAYLGQLSGDKILASGAEDQATGDHVVEGLLFFGDAGENVANAKGNELGNESRKVAAGGASKGNATALEIGDHETHRFLANGALPIGTFKVGVIEPSRYDAEGGYQQD
jgi:hypothetical protein